jgi:hypothetical protein
MTTEARTAATAARAEALVENLEWLIKFRQCEYACLTAVGYARKPEALKRQLMRIGRRDLIPRIFEYEQTNLERLGRS